MFFLKAFLITFLGLVVLVGSFWLSAQLLGYDWGVEFALMVWTAILVAGLVTFVEYC